MGIFTKLARDIFAPTDGGGNPRGADMGEAQTWGTEVESYVSVNINPVDRTTMATLDPSLYPEVFLREIGREGLFLWTSGDLSSSVTADPQQGIYVPPSSDTTGASGAWVRQCNRLNPKWFGAKGDGATDDSVPLQAAIDLALAEGRSIKVTVGTYLATFTKSFSSRFEIIGKGAPIVKGAIELDGTFPVSADTATPPDPTSAFLKISGIDFQGNSASYALTITAQASSSFIDTLDMNRCRFYGRFGFKARNLTTVGLRDSWFYNTAKGLSAESCTNWSVTGCHWRNASQIGVEITVNASNPYRTGGESIRFSQCEWAVCTIGLQLDRHQWASMENCLLDYCNLPINNIGSLHTKLARVYCGVSTMASLAADSDYAAAPSTNIAMLVKPEKVSTTIYVSGIIAKDCEFACYDSGSTQPVVLCDGYLSTDVGTFCQQIHFSACKFIMTQSHTTSSLLSLSYCANAHLLDNEFVSPNLSTGTLTAPYSLNNVTTHTALNSDTTICQESSVEIKPAYEEAHVSKIRMSDDSIGLEILNSAGDVIARFSASGTDRFAAWTNGALKGYGTGAADSGGAGYKQVIVPN